MDSGLIVRRQQTNSHSKQYSRAPRSTNVVYSSEVIHFRSRFVISEVNVAILVFPLLDWNIILLAYAFLFYSYRLYFISSGQLLLIFK